MIQLQNITKVYSTEEMDTFALIDANLHIERGEFITVCGPSGGGKSTLLSILGTHERPTSGTYLFAGVNVFTLSAKGISALRREKMSFIFQEFNLIDDLSVRDNVSIPLIAKGKLSKKEINIAVDIALEKLDMSHRASHLPRQLSGGQQQRVAIARGIVSKPEIIFADEPTGNLDTDNGAAVMKYLAQENESGCAICMVTHNPLYTRLSQRVVEISDGKIL